MKGRRSIHSPGEGNAFVTTGFDLQSRLDEGIPATTRAEWMLEGACAKSDRPDDWFPERGDTWVAREAKRVCREECPVATQCLTYAIENREVGIWGATDEVDRIKLTNHIDGTCQTCGKNIGPRSIRCRACENRHRNENNAA